MMPESYDGSDAGYMKLVKFKAILQNTDRYLVRGRAGGIFAVGGVRGKFKAYSVPIFRRYNYNDLVAAMEDIFNPNKSSALEVINDQELVQVFIDIKHRGIDKNFEVFHRLIFWLLFSAAICDDIYNNSLSEIVDLAYCFDFDEKILRDWCKAVALVVGGGKLSEKSPLKLETVEGNAFFLHK